MSSSNDLPASSKLKSILIIDDDKFIQKITTKTLTGHYNISCANSGDEGLEAIKTFNPDIILLDVEMPGLNGYEVCDILKQNPSTTEIPVIFLSGKTSIRERMSAYETGASDFITKPFEKDELLAKLKIHSEQHIEQKHLKHKVDKVTKTAKTAISGNHEYGQVIQFLEDTYTISSFDQLATRFFHVTTSLKLNCCLLFRTSSGNIFYSTTNKVTPLEKELMPALHAAGNRFHDFGCRTQINYQRISLLIKNMPLDDMETYGRYKDLIPSLMDACDNKIKTLDTEQALMLQSQNLTSSFNMVNETLSNLADRLDVTQACIMTSMKDMLAELEIKLPQMGLEDDQENYLINRIDGAICETLEFGDQALMVRESFQTVTRLLQHISERQQNLLDLIFTRLDANSESESLDDDSDSDIELF